MKKLFLIALLFSSYSYAQEGEIHGDFQLNLQSYKDDARIGAIAPDEIILNNSKTNNYYYENEKIEISSTKAIGCSIKRYEN